MPIDLKAFTTEQLYKHLLHLKQTILLLSNGLFLGAANKDLAASIDWNTQLYNILLAEFKIRPDAERYDSTINSIQGIRGE